MDLSRSAVSALAGIANKEVRGKGALERITALEIPDSHPVRLIDNIYMELRARCEPQHLPSLADMLGLISPELGEYCLVLRPVEADPFIDFLVLHRGSRIPGVELASVNAGELYTEHVHPHFIGERLMELASCLALKKHMLSLSHSARQSSLNIKVYRAVFPVWHQEMLQHAVVLAMAPIYTTIGGQQKDA
jgi:hypothetical protein